MAHICMISVNHSPLDDRIFYKEAKTLLQAGHKVSMICRADENGVMFDMGNIVPLNKPGEKQVDFEGVPTYPIKSPKSKMDKTLKKIFAGSFYADFIETAVEINADVYHAHEPESYYIGVQIAKINSAKVIFDSHESYTTGTSKEIWIKNRHLHQLQYLITANHITRGYLVSSHPTIKSTVIYNAAQEEIFTSETRTKDLSKIIIAHDGYLPFNRGLKEMLEAFKEVHDKFPEIKFKIIGATQGEEQSYLLAFIEKHSLQGAIIETGWVDYQEVAKHLQECAIGIIAKTPTVNNIIGGPPIKYFNYTAAGMAIIDVDMPETTRLLSKYKNGISVIQRNKNALSQAMLHLITRPELLRKYQDHSSSAFNSLNWKMEGEKLLDFYTNVVLNEDSLTLH